ncbi:hypothetical protein BD410DRAFT_445793 [Rickenella mellea]|uniref:Uncharacterized protein n=1 Tax=Rickenella mellea TaxID=50990 RepID=A0A4Y7PXS0_9AGAM|nr:hypothetical protein BD410DRAFT_445793 [Rickenella mellea]
MHTPMPVATPMQPDVALAQQGVPLPTILRNIQFHTGAAQHDFHPQVGLRVRRGSIHADGMKNPYRHAEAGIDVIITITITEHAQGYHHAPIERDTEGGRRPPVPSASRVLEQISHVRRAFDKPRPASSRYLVRSHSVQRVALTAVVACPFGADGDPSKKDTSSFKMFAARGRSRDRIKGGSGSSYERSAEDDERLFIRPSPTESTFPQPPLFLPPGMQYWAGVIMRNTCRKDERFNSVRTVRSLYFLLIFRRGL